MKRVVYTTLSLLCIFILAFPIHESFAQGNTPSGPVYIVQEGDSLWDIAARFHVSRTDLETANGITDSNQISIGEQLVIPGLEGIQGILTTQEVPFGETLNSLSLRYHIPIQSLKRLNHITSPYQIYKGYSLVILQNDSNPSPGKRISLGAGQTLLELSILNHTNPYSLMAGNGLDNSWSLLPGEVLRSPGMEDEGPGGLPSEITSISITRLIQGQTAEIQVQGVEALSLRGVFNSHNLNFFSTGGGQYVALQGVYAMAEPGLYSLSVQGTTPGGQSIQFSQPVLVHAGDFLYDRSLQVDPSTLDPDTNRKENDIWAAASKPATAEKQWSGMFSVPVEPVFAECYASRFGNRRSYNGGPYLYFHTGVDYCGQVGDPIYVAATGTVVYTGTLTVRGNATMIDHGWGVYTAYMHQSEILVHVGEHVEQGQLIGRVGNTGRVEGPHLHFEMIVGGVQVDPLIWLSQEFP